MNENNDDFQLIAQKWERCLSKKVDAVEQLTLFKTPEESPGYLLWHVSLAWRAMIEAVLKPLDLTHPQFVVLTTIAWLTRNKNIVSQIAIGRSAGLDPNSTSQIIRTLEAKKFIKRKQLLDERSKSPLLTDLGFSVLEKALPAVEQADQHFFARLSSKEMNELVTIFQKLKLDEDE